jgi:hypothetical protein
VTGPAVCTGRPGTRRVSAVIAVAVCLIFGVAGLPADAAANPASAALRARAFSEAYRLNHEAALEAAREAVAADPDDPAAHRALAAILWLNFMFRRGTVTADDYMGSMSQTDVIVRATAPAFVDEFNAAVGRALALAEQKLKANAYDVRAHFDVGAAVARRSAYVASVEGKAFGAFIMARRAFSEHEWVAAHEPARKDVGLVLGTYRYVVATQGLMKRWMAYLVGFGGDKARAISLLEGCAGYPGDARTEARFVLIVIYNREGRFSDAMRVLAELRAEYPENRLLWLESGATALRAGRPADARAYLDVGFAMFSGDVRPKAAGEAGLWHWKRGATLLQLGERDQAAAELDAALAGDCRDWVRGRVHLERGKLADLAGDRSAAVQAYVKAASLCQADNDGPGADEARARLRAPYKSR